MTGSDRRELLTAWIHLAVLWTLAFAQPLLEVLADTPEFFVARDNTRGDILILAFGLTLVPPTALLVVELLFLRLGRLRRALHLVFVGLLVAAIALQLLKDLGAGATAAVSIPLALAAGAAGALLYARGSVVRAALTVLAPAPAVFLAIFLLLSPVSELVLPQDEASASKGLLRGDTPVVMVVFDELSAASLMNRSLRIDSTRYPNFAQLARTSSWYRNATTVDYATERAVPAILTGTRPGGDTLPIASDHPHSLFTLLGARYALNVHEPATAVCPESLCGEEARAPTGDRLRSLADDLSVVSLHVLLPEDLEDGLPAVDATFEGFRDQGDDAAPSGGIEPGIPQSAFENRIGQVQRFLSRIRGDRDRPTLDFLHIGLPHWPWQYLPNGQQYAIDPTRIPGESKGTWGSDRFLPQQAYQRYLLQLGYVDRLLGRLVARLRREGLYDRALMVVTADHGVSFHPRNPRRAVSERNFADIAGVPLFVKAPRQSRGRVDDAPARTVDILPTVAELLGVREPWVTDGRSLRSPARRDRPVTVLSGREFTVGFSRFTRMRNAEVLRKVRLFGADDGGAGLFAPGSNAQLLGGRAERLAGGPASGLRVEIDDLSLLGDVDPRASLLPSYVRGRIMGPLSTGESVAVAVNGSIAAVVPVYRDGDEMRFGAILPADAFRRGRNEVDLYRVVGGGGATRLALVAGAQDRLKAGGLLERGGGVRIRMPDGRLIPVAAGTVRGYVEAVRAFDPGHLEIGGWTAGPPDRREVSRVLVFADGDLIAAGRPRLPRLDIAAKFGRAAVLSGYRLLPAYPQAQEIADEPSRLRVFGVLGGRAAELEFLPTARED